MEKDLIEQVLGYCINNPKSVLELPEELLYRDQYEQIYESLKERVIKDKDTSMSAVKDDTDLPASTITSLSNKATVMSEARYKELKDRALQQRKEEQTIDLLDSVLHSLVEEEVDFKETINSLREELIEINTSNRDYQIKKTEELIDEWREYYEKKEQNCAEFGFETLDEEIGGLRGTEFVILLGDTGAGKTNLMLNMARNMMEQDKSVMYFSLEMSRFELMDRMIPIVGSHSASELQEKSLSEEKLEETFETLSNFEFRIADSGGITSDDVIAELINQQADTGVDVVMVDYLQRLADPRSRYGSEVERLGAVARKLKDTALNMEVPIITPVQVDKSSSKGGTRRVENVAWSKDIANEADLAMYIYDSDDSTSEVPREKFVKVVKSRHSSTGTNIPVVFDQDNLRMMEEGHDGQALEDISKKLS